ncbi:hypothetical protein T492DRAFT_867248, partial [Pavlovales sp. CCMP2436]
MQLPGLFATGAAGVYPFGWQPLAPARRTPAEWRAIRALTRTIRRLKSRRLNEDALKRTTVLPIRFAIHLVHSQRRILFYRELGFFVVFVCLLLVLLLCQSPEIHECWETSEVLTEAFDLQLDGLDGNSPFNECKSPAQFWAWMREDFGEAIFTADPRLGELGELQLRVLRERPLAPRQQHKFHASDGVYALDTGEHTHGWGSDASGWSEQCGGQDAEGTPTYLLPSNLCLHHATNFSFLRNSWLKPSGYQDYGYGGYPKQLSTSNHSAYEAALSLLEGANLVDERVVAVSLTINVLNPHANLLSVVRVLFEFSRTVYDLDSSLDLCRLVLHALFYAMVLYYT